MADTEGEGAPQTRPATPTGATGSGDAPTTWERYYWNGTNWASSLETGRPPDVSQFEYVCYANGQRATATTPGAVCHWVPKNAPEGSDEGRFWMESKTDAEIRASQLATVGGPDVYIPTAAEVAAQREGLQRDDRGYYRTVNGQRVYETEVDPDTGQRFHWETVEGVKVRRYDDLREWTVPVGTPDELRERLQRKADELVRLRVQFKNLRGDSWVVRNNLLDRIRDVEDEVMGLNRALGADPVQPPTHVISSIETHPDPRTGIVIDLSFAIFEEDSPLSWSNPLNSVPQGAHVCVKASIRQTDRRWSPGKVRTPDVLRVEWEVPETYVPLDNAPPSGTDEFYCSDPLVLIRDFLAPTTGDTNAGRGTDAVFGVRAHQYELVTGSETPDNIRKEGDDGYWGAYLDDPDPENPSTDNLTRFINGLCVPESNCENLRPDGSLKVNPNTGAFGKWQIMPNNWGPWVKAASKDGFPISGENGAQTPKSEANQESVVRWRCGKIYEMSAQRSWRRVANAWHKGVNWSIANPGHFGSYAKKVLDAAGLPYD
jgi:hypothetical protein